MNHAVTDLVVAARALLRAEGYFVDVLWHASDIATLCEEHGWPVPDAEECKEIFSRLHAGFDGEEGISWPKLEAATLRYVCEKHGAATPLEAAQP